MTGSQTRRFTFVDIALWHRKMIHLSIFNRIDAFWSVLHMYGSLVPSLSYGCYGCVHNVLEATKLNNLQSRLHRSEVSWRIARYFSEHLKGPKGPKHPPRLGRGGIVTLPATQGTFEVHFRVCHLKNATHCECELQLRRCCPKAKAWGKEAREAELTSSVRMNTCSEAPRTTASTDEACANELSYCALFRGPR